MTDNKKNVDLSPATKAATSLLILLATFGLCEVMARFFAVITKPNTGGDQLFEEKYFMIQNMPKSANIPIVFLVGDSAMHRAVYPDLLEALLRRNNLQTRVYNLAFDGARGDATLCLLKTAAERGIKPSLVLWNFSPEDLLLSKENIVMNRQQIALIVKSHLGRCLLCKPHDPSVKLVCWLEKKFYLFRYRSQIKRDFCKFTQLMLRPPLYESETHKLIANYSHEITKKGWNPNFELWSEDYYQRDLALRRTYELPSQDRSNISQNLEFSLEKYKNGLEYCEQKKFQTCLVVLPFYASSLDQKLNYSLPFYEKKMAKAVSTFKKLHYIVIDGLNSDKKYFTDPRHTNILGAMETTAKLADRISSGLLRAQLFDQKLQGVFRE